MALVGKRNRVQQVFVVSRSQRVRSDLVTKCAGFEGWVYFGGIDLLGFGVGLGDRVRCVGVAVVGFLWFLWFLVRWRASRLRGVLDLVGSLRGRNRAWFVGGGVY